MPALAVVILVLAGCSGSGNADSENSSAQRGSALEGIVRSQLPAKVRQNGGPAVYVRRVQCTNATGNQYDCIATVIGTDGQGKSVTEDLGIAGTCDTDGCVWHTE